ncbi:hypothetical protein P8C59_005520 [Phyllachora maydis]|uniref:DNA mismatch repair protein HSM3 N-terminal domain-containing protein n=1 Tax=Phyllachora maydis TaxID=1825666 RepID=A0AAD9I663_9PEZI|nr:hypothetical protein P8C59_005520 [Phyllachora maydis]
MDLTPVPRVDDLDQHLDDLIQDPTRPLDAELFDHVQLQLNDGNIPVYLGRLLPKIAKLLENYNQDPTILANLAIKLLGPVPFDQAIGLARPESLVQALGSPAPSANVLGMEVLHKASASPGFVAVLSGMPGLLAAFIRSWLTSPHVAVAQQGSRVLGDLLDVDCPLPPPPHGPAPTAAVVLRRSPGTGRLWRAVLQDRTILALLVDLCAGRDPATSGDPKQLSLAQGRLLGILPRLATLNFDAVAAPRDSFPTPVHSTNGTGHDSPPVVQAPVDTPATEPSSPHRSLLQWAALHMVDQRDILMRLSLVDFFAAFVSLMRVAPTSPSDMESIRALLREAMRADGSLRSELESLPDRTVPEEADDLRSWLRQLLPGESVLVFLFSTRGLFTERTMLWECVWRERHSE